MLEKIKKLKSALTEDQFQDVADTVGPDVYQLFKNALDSKTEDGARGNMSRLADALRSSPMTVFKLYNKLNSEQKGIVMDLMEGEDG